MNERGQHSIDRGLGRVLSLLQYGRLMALLVCLALTCGLVFYVYSRAVYQSRALVRYDLVNLPLRDDGRQDGSITVRKLRERLASREMVERTALRLGLTKTRGNYESLRDSHVPKVEVAIVDDSTVKIDVFAYDPALVQQWQVAMVREFEEFGKERRKAQRENFTRVYREELAALSKRIDQEWREKLSFEQENSITELFVKQAGLTQLPREMVTTRQRIAQLEQTRKMLEEAGDDPLKTFAILSNDAAASNVALQATLPVPEPGRAGDALETLAPRTVSPESNVVVLPPTTVAQSPWQELARERQLLLAEVSEAQKRFLPGHSKMRELQGKLDRVNEALASQATEMKQRTEAEYTQLHASLSRLEAQLPDYREINHKYEEFRQTYALQQNQNLAWGDAYKELAKRMAAMEYGGDSMPVQLEFLGFTLMRDKDPVSPAKMKLLLMSLALGVALAIGVPAIFEKLSDTITRLDDAQDSLRLTGLGVVPVYKTLQLENVVRSHADESDNPDRLLEDFRLIRSSIALNRDVEIGTQAIMVTSARPGEGKSTIASNLAWAFASMGDRTLIVDCDLRRGRVHKILAAGNEIGLTDVLAGRADWSMAVQTAELPNLEFIPRGHFTPGMTERLCQEGFKELVGEWRKHYQRIILDTPPVLGLAEASSLQRVVDGTILVILSEQTPRREVEQALSTLRKSGGRMYGFVLNRLDLSKAANYYQYSYYSPYYYEEMRS